MDFSKVGTTTRWLLSPPPYVIAAVEVLIVVELVATVEVLAPPTQEFLEILAPPTQEFRDQFDG